MGCGEVDVKGTSLRAAWRSVMVGKDILGDMMSEYQGM